MNIRISIYSALYQQACTRTTVEGVVREESVRYQCEMITSDLSRTASQLDARVQILGYGGNTPVHGRARRS